MEFTDTLLGIVQVYDTIIILILSALVLCLLVFNLYLFAKLGRLSKSSDSTDTVADVPVESLEFSRRLVGAENSITQLREQLQSLEAQLAGSVQNIGLVRFDAFPDVGGEQSFALALLDQNSSGVVVSNLFSRTDSRVYAKEIAEGRSQHTLSDEEKNAILRAMNQSD